MKKLKIMIGMLLLCAACVDTLDDYNVDSKRASDVPAPTLFTGALKNYTDVITHSNVNLNNFRLYVQYWATTTYLDEPRYSMTSRLYSQNFWTALYRDVLSDLKEAKRIINDDAVLDPGVKNNQLAQIQILEVMAWSTLVNTFSDIPYTDALDPSNSLPKYDDAATVYADLLMHLDHSLGMLDPSFASFGKADVLYAGDVNRWIKFGNSLKLKLGMHLADVDPATSKTLVEEAAANVFTSNADNTRFPYMAAPPNNNPVSGTTNPLFTTREDFVVANTIVDKMNALNDPRRPFYFTTVSGAYVGGEYGFSNSFSDVSKPSDKITSPNFEALLLDYSEVEFLLAEAIERGYTVTGTAEEHYNNAIEASILYWGGTQAEADAYLANPAVAYTTAAGNYKERIGVQKWLALNNRGWDAWVEWRRLDYPALLPPSGPEIVEPLVIPVRMIYPVSEQTQNGASYRSASSAIGGDVTTARLFWDIF